MFASGKTAAVASAANYIEEVFSTYLYDGTSATQTITNGIDLSTKGGLVWTKARIANSNGNHLLVDTARGAGYRLQSNTTDAQYYNATAFVTSFNSNGYNIGDGYQCNESPTTYASWTFRKQPKFFDVVTYTGNGTNGRTVAHSLGSTPGCIIVKRTDAANGWAVYHRAMNASPQDYMMRLNATDGAFTTSPSRWNNTLPTSTEFTLSGNDEVNGSGATYVAYLFAHNAGGFGLTGTDNVISCGSFTTDGSGNATVNLGYEPQWILVKPSSTSGNWLIYDTMRGWAQTSDLALYPNLSNAELQQWSSGLTWSPTATGFQSTGWWAASQTYIYIAIRRGPMKVPTSGTSVFSLATYTGTAATRVSTAAGFPIDSILSYSRSAGTSGGFFDRLRGATYYLETPSSGAETSGANSLTNFASMTGYTAGADTSTAFINYSGTYINWMFQRAPSFFDVVCYTGTGTGSRAVTHNLGVAPEMVIVKQRAGTPDRSWWVLTTAVPLLNVLNSTEASNASGVPANLFGDATYNNYIAPTATTVTLSPSDEVNKSSNTYVAYLFATCAGVSKVGSYTGNGTTQTINCGFTGGARFVLIKRTDSTGGWYVYDTARGMTTLTDPYLLLNSTAAESATLGSVTTVTTGFAVNASILAAINTNAASYIFLAIA